MRTNKLWTMVLLVATLATNQAAWGEAAERRPTVGAVAVTGFGSYLLINAEGPNPSVAARGMLWDGPGHEVLRPRAPARFGGGVAAAASDLEGRFLYIAIAAGRVPRESRGAYRVAALSLPDLAVISSSIELDGVADEVSGVKLLVSPGGDELLVSFLRPEAEAEGGKTRPRLLRLPAPALVTEGRELEETEAAGQFSSSARWLEGSRIQDELRVRSERGEVLSRVNPYEAFGERAREVFADLRRIGQHGKPYVSIGFAHEAAERLLFVVNDDFSRPGGVARSGLVVYDLASKRTWEIALPHLAASRSPFSRTTPSVHLTPDGKRVVVEEYELRRPPDGDRDLRFRTGRLHVYEVESGARVATVSLPQTSVYAARVMGFSLDGRVLYYGMRESEDRYVYLVDVVAGKLLAQLDAGPDFDPYSVVAFAPFD